MGLDVAHVENERRGRQLVALRRALDVAGFGFLEETFIDRVGHDEHPLGAYVQELYNVLLRYTADGKDAIRLRHGAPEQDACSARRQRTG